MNQASAALWSRLRGEVVWCSARHGRQPQTAEFAPLSLPTLMPEVRENSDLQSSLKLPIFTRTPMGLFSDGHVAGLVTDSDCPHPMGRLSYHRSMNSHAVIVSWATKLLVPDARWS